MSVIEDSLAHAVLCLCVCDSDRTYWADSFPPAVELLAECIRPALTVT